MIAHLVAINERLKEENTALRDQNKDYSLQLKALNQMLWVQCVKII